MNVLWYQLTLLSIHCFKITYICWKGSYWYILFIYIKGYHSSKKTMNMLIDWTKKFTKDGVQSELMKLKYLTSIILWCRNFYYKMKYINQTYWKRKLPIVRKHHSTCILIRCPLKRYSCKAVDFVFDLYACTTYRNFQSLQRLRPQQLRAWWK